MISSVGGSAGIKTVVARLICKFLCLLGFRSKKVFRAFSSLNLGSSLLGMLKVWGDLFLLAEKV